MAQCMHYTTHYDSRSASVVEVSAKIIPVVFCVSDYDKVNFLADPGGSAVNSIG